MINFFVTISFLIKSFWLCFDILGYSFGGVNWIRNRSTFRSVNYCFNTAHPGCLVCSCSSFDFCIHCFAEHLFSSSYQKNLWSRPFWKSTGAIELFEIGYSWEGSLLFLFMWQNLYLWLHVCLILAIFTGWGLHIFWRGLCVWIGKSFFLYPLIDLFMTVFFKVQ